MTDWLRIVRGNAPLVVSIPHAGLTIPEPVALGFASLSLAIFDADFHVDRLYDFAREMDVTLVATGISRSVIDVNRDPSGQSLYPGQATTGLCPETGFDGTPLYRESGQPDAHAIAARRRDYFDPYHAALRDEISRLKSRHRDVVLYDAHSIRSHVPRLFDGLLPQFNIGTFDGRSCARALSAAVSRACDSKSVIVNGRFKGGWITRNYGAPQDGVHAIQMELAMRGYLDEDGPWPPVWNGQRAAPLQRTLRSILDACLTFTRTLT